jgi:hypothetical protein
VSALPPPSGAGAPADSIDNNVTVAESLPACEDAEPLAGAKSLVDAIAFHPPLVPLPREIEIRLPRNSSFLLAPKHRPVRPRPTFAERRARENAAALERLLAAAPAPFPGGVWRHALDQKCIPDLPSRAMASYWRAHPLRADRLARSLAASSGAPAGWTWRIDRSREGFLPHTLRLPPMPYREPEHLPGPGRCQICGRPVFRLGWHRDLWGDGRLSRGGWHGACVAAWNLWTQPSGQAMALKRRQGHRCAVTGKRLARGAEIDHRVPLFRVWREERERPWPELLGFWGAPNLQVINEGAHRAKCAAEAAERAREKGVFRDGPEVV